MVTDLEKMEKAKNVLLKIAGGVNPLNGEAIRENSFLNDPRIIRCFYYVAEILENARNGVYRQTPSRAADFVITADQKADVTFPEGKIGVNEFSKQVNICLDLEQSKKLTGVELNKKLKKMGILSEFTLGTGKTRTVTNENSAKCGLEMVKKVFNGVEYEMVVINEQGKKYLLENLETIMKVENSEINEAVAQD